MRKGVVEKIFNQIESIMLNKKVDSITLSRQCFDDFIFYYKSLSTYRKCKGIVFYTFLGVKVSFSKNLHYNQYVLICYGHSFIFNQDL